MTSVLKNVTLNTKSEVFLNDKVIARNFIREDGKNCSLGYVLPGYYEVTVEASETVESLGGSWEIMLPGKSQYERFEVGEVFYIPENETYKLKVKDYFDYYCVFGL